MKSWPRPCRWGPSKGTTGALRPNQPITREQAFAVLARAFVLEAEDTDALNTFPDKGEVSSWAANAVAALVENGYVTGSNGKLQPQVPDHPGGVCPGHQQSGRHLCGPERAPRPGWWRAM